MPESLFELAWVPKPFLSDLEWAVADAMVNQPNLQRNIPKRRVPLDSIEPTQHRLDHHKVEQMAKEGHFHGGLGFSRDVQIQTNTHTDASDDMLYEYGDIHVYLWDGHHRLAAARRAELEYIEINVFNLTDHRSLDNLEGMSLENFAAQLKLDQEEILQAMNTDSRRIYEPQISESSFDRLIGNVVT